MFNGPGKQGDIPGGEDLFINEMERFGSEMQDFIVNKDE